MFKAEFVNLHSGEIFRLPASYSDRIEACVCGQNYCRDRQQEDGTILFFRVVVDLEKHDDYCDEDCEGECERCGLCCEDEDEEDSEEPDWEQHREELFQSLLEYCRI